MEAGILHRDISLGNVMFWEDKHGKKRGVLLDLDLAFVQNYKEHRSHGTDTHRTGTLPFMAIDLLKTHLAHHDIESILWLLIFVTSEYGGGNPKNPFNEWGDHSGKSLADAKFFFLHHPAEYAPTGRYGLGEGYVQDLINTTASHHKPDLGSLLTHDDYLKILKNPLPP